MFSVMVAPGRGVSFLFGSWCSTDVVGDIASLRRPLSKLLNSFCPKFAYGNVPSK